MASGQCQLFSDNDRQVAQEVYQETQAYIQQCLKDGLYTADDIRKQTIEDHHRLEQRAKDWSASDAEDAR